MKTYVSDLATGTEVVSYFLVSSKPEVRKTKTGSGYLVLKLSDRSGEIEARLWGLTPGSEPPIKEGSVAKVRAEVTEWQSVLQLKISQIREVNESDDVDRSDLFQVSARPPEEMWVDLVDLLAANLVPESPITKLLRLVMDEHGAAMMAAPAAKSVHNAYLGGLLEHVLSMCRVAVNVAEHYELNKELLLAGCVLHDLAKTVELTYPIMGYTTHGTLLGHLPMGMLIVSEAIDRIPGFSSELRMQVLHLILAHHGRLEWGSAILPRTREAQALHMIDLLDSRMFICAKALAAGTNEAGFTPWVKELDGPVYQPKEED
jgi:3'-5' exoribonuclease